MTSIKRSEQDQIEINERIERDHIASGKYPLSSSTKKALGAVRAAGGDVHDRDILLCGRIDAGEITTEEAIEIVRSEYV